MFATRRHLSTVSSLTKCSLPRLAIGLGLLLTGLLLAPDRVQAQQDEGSRWLQTVDEQVATLVASSNPALRTDAMQLVIALASEGEAPADFSATRSALYDVLFDRAYADAQRILALSALHAVADDRMTQLLAAGVDELASDRIRRHVLLALEQRT